MVKKRALKLCVLNRKTFEGRQSFFLKKKKEKDMKKILVCFIIATVHFRNCLMANVFWGHLAFYLYLFLILLLPSNFSFKLWTALFNNGLYIYYLIRHFFNIYNYTVATDKEFPSGFITFHLICLCKSLALGNPVAQM